MRTLVGIFDKRAELYVHFATEASEATAIRTFGDVVNSPSEKNFVALHPEDYRLDKLALVDDYNGDVTPSKAVLIDAEHLVRKD